MHLFIKRLAFAVVVMASPVDVFAEYWIDEMDNAPEAYKLIKHDPAGKIGKAGIYITLEPGDCIRVIKPNATLSIASDSGPKQLLSFTGVSNRCIEESGAKNQSNVFSNMIAWAGRWLTNRIPDTAARTVVTTAARGDEIKAIKMPLANHGGLKMVGGNRPLVLAWEGGEQPFGVRMVSEDRQRILFDKRGLTDRRVKIDPVFLAEGIYHIEISDTVGMIEQTLYIVSSAEVPPLMPAPHDIKGLEDRIILADAVRLASQGDGWAFEAYQTAAQLAAQYQLALILRDSLERGDMPQAMPE